MITFIKESYIIIYKKGVKDLYDFKKRFIKVKYINKVLKV